MKVINGKIREASESELFEYWLKHFDDIYSYQDYKQSMIRHGVIITDDKIELNKNDMFEEFIEYLKEKKFKILIDIEDETFFYNIYGNNIIMQIYSNDNGKTYRMGIDPSYCFDKLSRCSILCYFPMSRREYKRMIKLIDHLSNPKDKVYRDWYKEAPRLFCGEYNEFGI